MNEYYFTAEVKNAMENVRQSLFSILDSLEGEKTVVWDSLDLIRRIDRLTGALGRRIIATHGVVEHLMLQKFVPPKTPYVLFFLSPLSTSLDDFFEFIDKCDQDEGILYEVVFIPGASYQVKERLREAQGGKYWERLEAVKEIPFWWLPTDGHCLSLNEPELPSRLLLNLDWTVLLHPCAEALNEFLTLCPGKIPCYSKGQYAEMVAKMVYSEKKPFNEEILPCKRIRLNRIIIIDRWMDPLTPLLTQLTFSGLLDELYGIETNTIKVPQSEFEGNEENIPPNLLKTIHLQDETFQEIRYIHREFWGIELSKMTQAIEEEKKKLSFTTNTSLAEYNLLAKTKLPEIMKRQEWRNNYYRLAEMMMQFDSPLSELVKMEQDLLYGAAKSNERGLLFSWVKSAESEQIPAFIEDLILEAEDLIKVLRLIAIHSLTSGGLKSTVLAIYRRLLWQSYGPEAVNKLLKMQKIGLLAEKGEELSIKSDCSPFSYTKARKNYKILLEPGEENNKQDLAKNPHYAYNGYSPLLLQILKEGEKSHWDGWNRRGEVGNYDGDKTAVFVIGGVTRSELALIQQMPNIGLVLTTAVITGKSLLENLTKI